jgi:frataxin-like iron-binding protein CyaY
MGKLWEQPLTIQPGETVRIDLPYRGSVLAVETDTGSIYILRR